MRCAGRLALVLVLFAVAVLGVPVRETSADGPDEALAAARQHFVETRDTCTLVDELDRPTRDPAVPVDALLALVACDRAVSPATTTKTGYPALPAVVGALKRLDLAAAELAAGRVGDSVAGGIGIWAKAVVAARRGEDGTAVRHLLELPPVTEAERPRASFTLALFGAALPTDDRLLLAATGRQAILELAQSGDVARLVNLARSLSALDLEVGAHALCLAFRSLRRLGNYPDAERLLTSPEVKKVPGLQEARHCFWLELAIAYWRTGAPDRAKDVARRIQVGPQYAFLIEALKRTAVGLEDVPWMQPAPAHVPANRRSEVVLARFATLLGVPSRPDEVAQAARQAGLSTDDPRFARRWLEARGFRVAVAAGSGRAGDAALARDLPFLHFEIRLDGDDFRDTPAIVRARDSESGLWLLEDFDLHLPDARPADAVNKSWCMVAVPGGRDEDPSGWIEPSERRLGRAIEEALGLAATGDLVGASQYLDGGSAHGGDEVVHDLYRAFFFYRRHMKEPERVMLQHAYDAVRKSAQVTPYLIFELVVLGKQQFVDRDRELAIQSFDRAQRLAPDSASLARSRWTIHAERGERLKANNALELARVLDPTDTVSLALRGRFRSEGGDVAGARGDLRRAFDRDRSNPAAALDLAWFEIDRKRGKAALDVILQYVSLVPEALSDDDVLAARYAAEAFVLKDASTLVALEPLLESPLPEIRRRVAISLDRIKTPDAEQVLRDLLSDPHPAVRGTALKVYMRPWLRAQVEAEDGLGRIVVAHLRDDESEIVRGAAAGLLGLVRKDYAVQALARALVGAQRDAEPLVRAEAALALGRQEAPRARRVLVEALSEESRDVRKAAIEALFHIAYTYLGYDPDAPEPDRKAAIERWLAWLKK